MKKEKLVRVTEKGRKIKLEFDPLYMMKSSRGEPIPPAKVFRSKKEYKRHPKHRKNYLQEYGYDF